MLRFIATHMSSVRTAPDEPMSAPTMMRRRFESMKPSAHSAQPDAELRHVITTGMSAPPIDEVRWAPRKADDANAK